MKSPSNSALYHVTRKQPITCAYWPLTTHSRWNANHDSAAPWPEGVIPDWPSLRKRRWKKDREPFSFTHLCLIAWLVKMRMRLRDVTESWDIMEIKRAGEWRVWGASDSSIWWGDAALFSFPWLEESYRQGGATELWLREERKNSNGDEMTQNWKGAVRSWEEKAVRNVNS